MGHFEGNIAYSGGGWVHPKYRGRAVSTMAVMLIHAKLLQDFDIDYCFSVVRPELVEKNVTLGTYR